jgi:hypothetical protein
VTPGPRTSLPGALLHALGKQVSGPVMEEMRRRRSNRQEPRARLLREQRQATRTLWVLLAVTLICALVVVTAVLGATISVLTLIVAGGATLLGAGSSARTGVRVGGLHRQLKQTPRTRPLPRATGYRLPPVGSKARAPMQRLSSAEESLSELLEQLLPGSGVAPVPASAIVATRSAADEAAGELRKLAAQLAAVEGAAAHAGRSRRGSLSEAATTVRRKLEEGVDAYGALVAAAGETVAASASPMSRRRLTDATDHLGGLAVALAELARTAPTA